MVDSEGLAGEPSGIAPGDGSDQGADANVRSLGCYGSEGGPGFKEGHIGMIRIGDSEMICNPETVEPNGFDEFPPVHQRVPRDVLSGDYTKGKRMRGLRHKTSQRYYESFVF